LLLVLMAETDDDNRRLAGELYEARTNESNMRAMYVSMAKQHAEAMEQVTKAHEVGGATSRAFATDSYL
jgi:hypothetical protein